MYEEFASIISLKLLFSKRMINCQEISSILCDSVLHNLGSGCAHSSENSQWDSGWELGKGGQIPLSLVCLEHLFLYIKWKIRLTAT